MTEASELRIAATAGWVTLVTGTVLVGAPRAMAGITALDARTNRVLGVTDLVLVPGLLVGRPRWPWLAARAGLSVAQAALLWRTGRRNPRLVAAVLAGLTALDASAAIRLVRGPRFAL